MKGLLSLLVALTWTTGALSWGWDDFPVCASTCIHTFVKSGNTQGYVSSCANATLVTNVNSCVDASACSASEKTAIHQNIAQLCADIATFTKSHSDWHTRPWSSGWGPFGGSWGDWRSSGAWTDGPWTSWWCGDACPYSDWPGWTSGAWSTGAPWTTWTACTATTTATTTYTTVSAGSVVTGVSYGIKVAQQTGTPSPTATPSGSTSNTLTSKASARVALGLLVIPLIIAIWG
ncbi:hypothetical protein F5884DRAFT_512951 [Xylogone sp. PMI_703]|nr:hypothetical protein F5884DRAFT_512951 [Xylogone sp. PMI_703]